jgi:ketosteroid isomerase-like protein
MLPSNTSEWENAHPPPAGGKGPRISGGLLLTIGLLVILIGIIVFAVTRLSTTPAPPRSIANTAPAATAPAQAAPPAVKSAAGAPADAATQAAIQQVIRKLDDAQAQAIASGDQRVMVDTATPDFYQQQVAVNQDLMDNGVTEVELLNMEWGDITVTADGNTATASVYETWSTTFDDGTTQQSRDLNVYTLIKDQQGAWRIQADEHPEQPTAP